MSSETIAGDAAGNYTVVRTFTATDDAGNSTSATQTITVEDTTAPEFTSIPADYTSECSDDLILDDATASDNCGEVTIEVSSETIAGDAAGNYTVVRTFTATDDAGNSTSATQTITVEDTTAPEFTSIPADYTSECSDDLILDDATASDNCGEVTIEVSSETIAGDAAGNYTVVRTFTATDDAGNSTSATQTITVEDTTAPEFTSIPADYTSECSDDLILDDATASDNCGEVTIEVSSETIAGDAAGNYTVVRTFTATDDAGNSTSATQTITVEDTTAPEFTSIPADYTSECSDDLILDDATASDNCGEVTIEVSSETIAGDAAGNYTVVRTFTATDDAGNSTSATQTITVEDTTAPEFTSIPADYTSECSDDLILDDATASDNCGEVTIEVSSETIAGDAAGNYTVVRTFTATDDAGNSTSATQTITVEDTTAPEFTSIPADYTSECSDDLILDDATASDNCGEVTIEVSSETIAGDAAGNYTVVRTFTATDDAGNSTSATQTITVEDTTAPEFTSIPADYTSECSDDLILDDATASDNCGEVTIEVSSETIAGDAAGNYTVVRTFTATDDAGNSTSATQTITVEDTTAPEFTSIPADYTSECSDELIYDDASAIDNCGEVSISVLTETIAGDCVGTSTIIRTFTATDDAGNSSSATQTISVVDTTAPELVIPEDYTAECDEDLTFDDASATDNCAVCDENFDFTSTVDGYGLSLELVASHEGGALDGMRTYRVYLDVANSDDQVTSLTGNDEFALAFNTTTSFYQNAFGGPTPNDISAGAIGLVPELEFDSYVTIGLTGQPEGQEGTVEMIPGTWMDTFEAGQSFTINDGIGSGWYIVPPTAVNGLGGDDQRVLVAQLTTDGDISGQFRTQVFPQGDQENDVRADLTFSHTHSCTDVTIEVSSETIAGDCVGNYTIERTFTATDDCGNSTSAIQTITVEDTTAPEFTSIPADYTSECSDDLILDDATASDNCGEVTIEVSSETIAGDCAGNYTVVRTFTATDDCGNSTSATQTITVQDTTAPEFTSIPADYTSECSDDLILDDATASDNCGEVTIEVSSETIAGDCAGNYTVVRTFTATDDCGNSTSATQTITVQDTTAPEWITSSSTSGFTGDFAPELWVSTEGVSISGSTLSIQGYDELNAAWSDGFGQQATAQCVSSGATVSFDWSYNTTDSDGPSYDPGFYINGSLVASLTDDNGSNSQSGSFSFDCIGGDAIGFAVNSTDGAYGEAFLTITNFTITSNGGMLPEDITVECDEVPVATELSASDNCSDVSVDYLETREDGSCPDSYTLTRVWTATDDCGNATIHTQTIAVEDTTAPEFTSIPADYTSECSDDLILDDATASDNCGEVTIDVSSETIAGDCAGNYTVVRTFTATDDCGNSTSATQTITVQDTTAPEFTSIPADYTSECSDDLILDDATASDNCGEVTIEVSSETIAGDAAGNYTVVRTFTATDDCGNSTSATQTITVEDTTAPEFTSIPADYTSECSDDLILDDATASDNCGEVTIEVSSETIAGDAAGNYTVVRTFTATDDAGNSTSATQTITVEDTTAPEFTSIPADYTSECSDDLILDDATASDNCGEVTIEVSSETIAGDAAGNYTVVRTFTATDDAGNSTSATQTITVEDTTAPEFTSIPADYTSECSDDLILDDATASDNCGEVTIEVSSETIAGDAAGNYTVVRTFTATDDAGNSTSATQTITVEDTTAPEFTSIPADYTSECSDDLILDDATASDNCGEVTIEVSSETIAGDAAGNYTVVRTFTATDDAGNSTSATQTITVEDTTAPEFTSIPADYTSECSDDLILDDATASDNCGEVTIEVSSETIAGDAAGNYTVVRTFTATDDAGNSTSATQTITVEDTTAPEFTSIPADYTSECNVDLGLIDGAYGAGEETIHLTLTLDDYGSETTWSIDGPNGNVANGGPYSDSYDVAGDNETFVYEFDVPTGCYTLTVNDAWGDGLQYNGVVGNYTLTDDSGNVLAQMVEGGNFGSQAIHEFCVDPGLALPSDLLATDNCGAISYSVVSDTTAGDCAGNYTIVRTFTATDDAGNSASATQTITVEDTTAPEFTSIPADYTSECSDDLILDDATASDNCGEVTVTVDIETIAGDAAGNYTVVRTFTATDDCGNSTSATQTITVEDTTAPEFTSIPADYTSECSDDLILDDATASDNCGEVTIEVSSETIAGDCVGNYTVVRTFTATDDAGNSTSATQTIIVQDTTDPEFTSIPADYTSECSDDLILDDATASDNCGEVTIEVSSETIAGDCAGNYTVVRTFTATDDCGNSTSATQTITVEDTTAPELTIPADYTSECSDDLILDDATASDNCGEVTIEVSSETIAGDCVGNYTIERTFTATDDCGNSTSATQRITVQDTTAPEFTSIPADYTSECSDDLILDDATASDNCGEVTIEVSSETIAGDCVGNYTVVRTFTATDDCGNSTSATQTITVEDMTAPELTIPSDYTSECSDDLILDDATASDNCGEVTIEVSSETIAGDCAGNYTVVRTFTATDDCGNSTSATQTITVEDTTAPEFTSIPADYTSECSDDLILDDATASDNCGEVTIEVSSETIAGDCVGNYTIERTFTATDDCGNSTSAIQTITVEDTTAPEFTSIPADYTSECSDDLILDDATASDNCGEVTIEVSSETIAGDCAGNYTVVRTFTATDDCGNSTSATQTITVEDTTAPEFTSIPADYTSECSDDLILDDATASDNCGEVTIEVSSETIAGDCAGNYTVVRTFTATDDCGNSTSATQTITVQDTTAPEWITSSSTSGFTGDFAPELWVSTEGVSISGSTLSIQGYDELNAAWSDGFGQQATAQCVSSGATVSFDWSYNTTDSDGPSYDPGFYINGSLVASLTDDNGSNSQSGSFSFDCIGGDAIGFAVNSTDGAYGEAFLTITNFTITSNGGMLPEDITVECDEVPVATELSASDNCSDVSVDYLETREDGSCPDSYTLTRVWTATDDCGNATIHTQTIAVEDTTAPEFTSIPADYTAECTDELIYDDASAIDNCGEVSISVLTETIAGDCIGTSTIIRTFTATDDCGNSSSATQTISVVDTTAPELVIPEDYTAECDEDLTFDDASATDNCAVCDENFDFTSTVDGYGLSLELVASHEGGALDGMRTYRVYLDVANSDDQVTSLTGNDEFALAFNTTTSFYQNAFGGPTPNDISAGAIGLVPELEFDSYVTIGLTGQPEGQEGTVEMIPGTWMDTFEAGQSFTINDGIGSGWYIVPPTAVNGLGGDDQRVLVAQLTTDGDISGQFRTQVFPQGDQENDVRADLTFSHTHSCTDVTIEVSSETIAGDCVGNYTIERTFTATDDCGNSTSAIQTITVEDTTAPEFTSIPADYTSECSDDLILDDATASDNCGEVTIEVSSETIAGDCAGNYTVVRTFTATDDCGNSTSATQTITVQDTTAPEFTSIPADYTSECSDDLILDDATASDNCGEVTIEVSSETIAGDAAGNYTVVRTFTATDDCGNSTSATQTITVEDTTAPEFTSIPADYTSECSDDLILDDATASDNCGEVTIEVSSETIAGDAAGNYTVVRTFTATDDAGNSTSATQTITVEDTTAPEFTSIPADYTSECSDDLILDDATASDNCGEVTIEVSSETIAGDAAGNYTVVRTFTATDDAGNSTSATQTITVEDTTAPEFTSIPADYTSECSDDLILDDATASDNCGEVTIEVSSETIAGDAAGNYTVVRTFTATDDAGNSTSATQTITVEDTTAPEFTSIPADYTSECSDDLILDDATASDNCGEVTIEVSSETIAGDAAGNYTVVRTFTATDDAGNSTSATQTITVEDTTAPEFTSIPADYTSECSDDLILDDATASDNCGEVTIEVSSETIAGDAAGNYTVVRTFTATDDAGNSTSATQTITVEDTTAPEFTSIPADYTSECSDDLILDDATASDNCGEVTIEVSSETIAGDAAGNYTVVRTFTATDDAGNSTSATQTITVEDTTAPEFTSIPADYTSECSDDLILDDATASDNCGEVTIEVSSETIAGDAAGNYTVVRTFTATDDAGNSTSATQTITVEDTTAPEFTSIPADYTSECNVDLGLIDGAYGAGEETIHLTLTLDDYGSETTWSIDGPNGNVANGGPYSDSYDVAGDNETFVYEFDVPTGCYTLTVNDAWGDGLQYNGVVGNYTLTDDSGNVLAQMVEGGNFGSQAIHEFCVDPGLALPSDLLATDNCGAISYSVVSDTTAGDCAGNYTIVRTFTATDDAGNSASATQTITVEDTTAPEFTSIPADYTSECSDDLILDDATASDNCGEVTVTVDTETIAGDAAGNYTVVRTFTATDDCGNSTSATQTITVEDTTAPEFTSIPADYTSECSDDLILDDATASDNCGEVTIEVSSETIAGDAAGNYTVVRTFTATDDAGNSTSATQTITVEDTTAPELTIPADYTSECSDDLILDDATASDNCGEVTIEVSSETIAGDAAGNYTVVRTFTATDDAGNSTSATQTITVEDTTAPEFTSIPADYTSECSDDLILDDATASDNCGEVTIEVSSETIAGDAAGNYTVVRTFTATDDAGNSTSATQTITVEDTTAPEFTSIPADYTSECSDDLILDDATASDNCGEVTIEVSSETIAGDAAGNYTVVRTFTATDDAGNSTSATQTITVEDTTAPEFTSIPADYTSECSDDLILDDATASDNCGEVTIEVSSETIAGDAAGNYTVVRTFTATDDAGNSTSATQTITVEDTTAPEFTSIPADYTSECSDDLILDDATASDNCGEVTIEVSSETIAGDAAGNYTVVRTFTATDDAGNSTSATQTITVEDTTAPEFTSIPADYTSECSDDLILDDATASDNCGEVTIEVSSETIAGDAAGNYTVVRTFTATDDAGNSTSATQTITVEDTTAPEFTSIPADYTSECSDDLILDDATASDNCGEVTIEVSSETIAGDAAGNYTVVRTFTATDDAGNSTSATQTITVEDTTAPEFTSIPADYTSECSDDLILDDATASDNCGEVTIEVSSETIAGDAAGNYTVVRTFTATDDAGNSTSATQTITVEDTTAPELTIPADYTSECSDDLILDDATASDNCGEVTIEVSSETIAGDAAGNYTVVRTFTATDDAGNSTSATQTITVEDTTAPEFTSIPADYTSECSDDLILDDATASDNCGEVTIEVSSETIAGDAAGNYTVVRTFTATDDAGNSTSATQTITVEDTTAPEFTSIPADYTSECSDDLILDDATASDNCGEVTIEVSSETIAGDATGNYTVVRTFTATDDAGNSTSATQTITVEDTTAPEFTSIPADYTSECSDDLILDDATASDNCGEVTIEVSSETIAGDAAGNYTVVRTFTATDDAGNSTSATQTITVEDTTAPEFTSIPADYTSECSDDLILDDASATDNCGEVTIEVSSETIAGDAAGNYTVVRTFTATDDAGNSTSATQTITVEDTTAPELVVPADYTAECSDDLILDDASATDNCGEVTIEVSSETIAGDCSGNYTVVRTFTATDDAGNSTSATQTITVEDTTAPELTVPADYTAECTDDLILDDATATDNCSDVTIEMTEETLPGSCVNGYVLVRTFTATDACGNVSTASQTITVEDTTGPELFLPPSYEADCGDELVLLDALASDACGLAIVTVEESYDYTCDNGYVLTRTFTAVDACFNETVGVQTITVTDTTAPEFTSVPEDYSAECSDELTMEMATATDDCGEVTIAVDTETIDGDCANTYTLVRTFTATDGCGNSTTATQTIEVSDTTAPEFTFVPADELIECNISLDGAMATAVDNCGDVTVTVEEAFDQGACGGSYVITRTFTATDACGNSTVAVQTITQEDTTPPTLEIAEDATIECDQALPEPSSSADDACGAVSVEVTEEIVAGDCPQEMTVLRTYTATDDCGNSTSAVQTIHVVDTTAPTFTFTPEATSTVFAAEGDTLAEPFVVVLDNCDTEATWSVEETILVDSPNEFTVERVYTAMDACGNTATYTEVTTLVLQVLGCTDPTACNYDEFANEDDDSCFFPLYAYDCDGNCINDVNENGICDELEVAGCTDPENPGYNPEANIDDGSCLTGGCTIAFACNYDPTAEFQIAGSCEFTSCAGCTSADACNYDEEATLNDGSCEFPDYGYDCNGVCINDADGDGICDEFEIAGCTDPSNPAYNPNATDDDGSCLVAGCLLPFACNFDPTADYLDIALCDLNSCSGCTDPASCTYDPSATLSAPADCTYPANQFLDCDGVCINDADGDGICDEQEIPGCTDPAATNYSPFATDDNGSCIIEVGGCTLPFACNYDPSADFYLPGSCDFSCLFGMPPGEDGCTDELACNYGADEPCIYFDENGDSVPRWDA